MGQHCTGKTLRSVVPEAQDNITQEKIQAMSSEQHLVTPCVYVCVCVCVCAWYSSLKGFLEVAI